MYVCGYTKSPPKCTDPELFFVRIYKKKKEKKKRKEDFLFTESQRFASSVSFDVTEMV